jgi:hypothetical protein
MITTRQARRIDGLEIVNRGVYGLFRPRVEVAQFTANVFRGDSEEERSSYNNAERKA